MEVVVEAGDHAADLAVVFVDPDRTGEFLRGVFGHAVCFGVRIADEIEGDDAAIVHLFAARVRDLHDLQQAVTLTSSLSSDCPGGVFEAFSTSFLTRSCSFFCSSAVNAFAVLFYSSIDFVAVDEENIVLFAFVLLDVARSCRARE